MQDGGCGGVGGGGGRWKEIHAGLDTLLEQSDPIQHAPWVLLESHCQIVQVASEQHAASHASCVGAFAEDSP